MRILELAKWRRERQFFPERPPKENILKAIPALKGPGLGTVIYTQRRSDSKLQTILPPGYLADSEPEYGRRVSGPPRQHL
ncbi:hypothetical protein [Thermococcus waiotapuensis]|uniref:Uncharacterized protein n=1 Tax=Thermococcus waiotapuensis TaxID=90909 RepID=A0AAE4NTJ1_9EURY|nr:hypothetical protein [Thermococcus waiotapuensis]MDV3103390.1 hypothetical protein [Thermococcus waiotapuensis]